MEMHYNNAINIVGLNESECMAQCCYSENTGTVEQTGCEKTRERRKTHVAKERQCRWHNNKVKEGEEDR